MISTQFGAWIKRVDSTDVDIEIQVTLSYDAGTDPYAVQAVFEIPGGEDRVWFFSRELLREGSHSMAPYGKGDVKFRLFPLDDLLLMCLRNPDGHADIALPYDEVERFLRDTSGAAAGVTEQECDSLVDVFLKELFKA